VAKDLHFQQIYIVSASFVRVTVVMYRYLKTSLFRHSRTLWDSNI